MTIYPTECFAQADHAFREALDQYHAHEAGVAGKEAAVLAMDRTVSSTGSAGRGRGGALRERRMTRLHRWGLGCWLAALPAAATAGAVGLSGGTKVLAAAIGAALAGLALARAVERATTALAKFDGVAGRTDGGVPGEVQRETAHLAGSAAGIVLRNLWLAFAMLLVAIVPLAAGGMACFGFGSPASLLAGSLSSLVPAAFLLGAPFQAGRVGGEGASGNGADPDGRRSADREQIRIAAARFDSRKGREATRRALYRDVKRTAQAWEAERGYTADEQRHLAAELPRRRKEAVWLKVAAGALLLLATYPASLTLAQALRLPFQYLPGPALIRVSWIGSAFWIALLAVAEMAIVRSLVEFAMVRHGRSVLEQGYEAEDRWQGKPCMVIDRREAAARLRRPLVYLALGALLFALELACNVGYLLWFADTAVWTRVVLPFAPTLAFLLLAMPFAENAGAMGCLALATARTSSSGSVNVGKPRESRLGYNRASFARLLSR